MSRSSLALFLGALALFGVTALDPDFVPAQAGKDVAAPEKVRFETADGVKIHGTFFQCPKKGAPAVIMVHNIGETSNKQNWIDLAKTLQPDFSVLTFDLRGHGNSVEIDNVLYSKYQANRAASPKALNKQKLDWKDIDKSAYNLFVNDIAAAKSYLERTKNDLGMCNTQNTILIGVEQGATLAAIYANSEWYRFKIDFMPIVLPPFFQIRSENRPEGQYLTALVGLSITPKLGSQTINLANTLAYPCKVNGMPGVFIHGDGDPKDKDSTKDKEVALALEKALKAGVKKGDTKLQYTRSVEMKGAGKLRGVDLLLKSLKTSDGLADYLKTIVQENPQEWTTREFSKTKYAWKMDQNPNNLPIPARVYSPVTSPFPPSQIFPPTAVLPDPVEKNLSYDTYMRFIAK